MVMKWKNVRDIHAALQEFLVEEGFGAAIEGLGGSLSVERNPWPTLPPGTVSPIPTSITIYVRDEKLVCLISRRENGILRSGYHGKNFELANPNSINDLLTYLKEPSTWE